MKNKFLLIIIIGLSLLPILSMAQGGITPVTIVKEVNIWTTINTIMNWALGLLIVLAAAFVLASAFIYLSAAGDPEKVGKAKTLIIYAVIAIIIGVLSKTIVFIAASLLGIGGGSLQ